MLTRKRDQSLGLTADVSAAPALTAKTIMSDVQSLDQFLNHSAQKRPDHLAVEEAEYAITYAELDALSDRVRNRLWQAGVRARDRVGVYMHKSIDAVASIFGILKAGATYVPVDPLAPASRNAYIFNNCSVHTAIVEDRFVDGLRSEMAQLGEVPAFVSIAGTGGGKPLDDALRKGGPNAASVDFSTAPTSADLAYILYTSGSTGRPKGVMLSHRNGTSFVDWCSDALDPRTDDRFSSHAPFHFDLSILDIYVPIKHGATLVLISEEVGKDPVRLARYVSEKRISVWYSTPSILSLLAQFGDLPSHDYSALRTVLFAGEVFPVKHLRALQALLPDRRYFNLYGPTETNVCTYYEVPSRIPADRVEPFPIGQVCSHLRGKVVDEQGQIVDDQEEGELCISGPGVTQGYWKLPEQTQRAFLTETTDGHWYKTGDLVIQDAAGNYLYRGRRDRMIKKRGYRVELGEIESCLYRHPSVKEAAAIAITDEENGVRVKAFLSTHDGGRLSLIALKQFCSEHLPPYMVPDLVSFQVALPKTSTDKIDYQRLKELS
jgi:amino acid adenylation domain-containing protein